MRHSMAAQLQVAYLSAGTCSEPPLSDADMLELQSMLMQLNWLCDLLVAIANAPASRPAAEAAAHRLLQRMVVASESEAVQAHIFAIMQRLTIGDNRGALRIAEALRHAAA